MAPRFDGTATARDVGSRGAMMRAASRTARIEQLIPAKMPGTAAKATYAPATNFPAW
jgi:hypothetical protein